MLRCPRCASRAIGKVTGGNHYCWDCCIEFRSRADGSAVLFEIDDDGTLQNVNGQAAQAYPPPPTSDMRDC